MRKMKKASPLMIERKLVNFNLDAVYDLRSVTYAALFCIICLLR